MTPGTPMWYATFALTTLGIGRPLLVTVVKVGKRGRVKVRWAEGDETWVKADNLYPVKATTTEDQ